MVLTLNDAAFARLLAYTGLEGGQLIRAIPSLTPRTFRSPGEPPAIRISFLRPLAAAILVAAILTAASGLLAWAFMEETHPAPHAGQVPPP